MPLNQLGQPVGDPVERSRWPDVVPVTLSGARCVLEPWSRAHQEALYDAVVRRSPASTWTYLRAPDLGNPAGLGDLMDALDEDPAAVPLVIRVPDGPVLGTASYLRLDAANGSVEVGWVVLGAELQRTAAATEAMFLMMRHAFDDLGYRRYEWKCDSLNGPSRRAAERLGFTYEGTHRSAMVYRGRNRDTAWFSLLEAEWPRVRRGLESWLSPDNFGPDGRQRSALDVGSRTAGPA